MYILVGPLKAPPWQTCLFRHQLDFSGKHSSHAAMNCARILFTHISTAVNRSGTHLYSWVEDWGIVERAKMSKLWNSSKPRIRIRAHLIASPAFYQVIKCWATAFHNYEDLEEFNPRVSKLQLVKPGLEICGILVANATMFSHLLPGFWCGSKHLLTFATAINSWYC